MSNRQNNIKKHFDNLYQRFQTPWKNHLPEPLLKNFFKKVKDEQVQTTLLDIGCGDGWISLEAASLSFDVWGIDSSLAAINIAKKSAIQKNLQDKVEFRIGDALKLPYRSNFFTAIIDRGLFHHILPENRKIYFQNVERVGQTGSLMYLAVFSRKNPEGIGQRFSIEDIYELFDEHFHIISFASDPFPSGAPAHLLHFILKLN